MSFISVGRYVAPSGPLWLDNFTGPLWLDNFNRSNNSNINSGSPSPGWTYIDQSGPISAYGVISNNAGFTASGDDETNYRVLANYAKTDSNMKISMTLAWDGNSDGSKNLRLGIWGRMNTSASISNGYLALFDYSGSYATLNRMFKIVGGSLNQIGTNQYGSGRGTPHTVSFNLNGSSISATDNDTLGQSLTDTTYSAGQYCGFWLQEGNRGSGSNIWIDDFSIDNAT